MPDDSNENKPKKTMTLRDLFQTKHGPAAFQRMKANPGLTLGEALKAVRDVPSEKQEEGEDTD